jgi:hypothetical protein
MLECCASRNKEEGGIAPAFQFIHVMGLEASADEKYDDDDEPDRHTQKP